MHSVEHKHHVIINTCTLFKPVISFGEEERENLQLYLQPIQIVKNFLQFQNFGIYFCRFIRDIILHWCNFSSQVRLSLRWSLQVSNRELIQDNDNTCKDNDIGN